MSENQRERERESDNLEYMFTFFLTVTFVDDNVTSECQKVGYGGKMIVTLESLKGH